MWENLQLPDNDEPIYRRLADAIAQRIASGELAAGDRLPPQRDIARAVGLNVTTVTRAFSSLQQRGLVEARRGRGTLVAPRDSAEDGTFRSAPSDEVGLIDLSVNRPATTAYLDGLAPLLAKVIKDRRYAALQDYHPPEGPAWARQAAAQWLAPFAGSADAGRVVLTDGAQHGLACVFTAIATEGDVVLSDAITYQGISALCRSQRLELRGVAGDRAGMLPDAFEAACMSTRPRAVFLVPTLHNPTTVTLSADRRLAIAAIARRHNVLIVEDDVYRPLAEDPPRTFASIEPELAIYVSCLSKCIAPGLRLGFVTGPRAVMGNVAAALRVNCWSISPLTALIGTILLEEGMAKRMIATQREELRQRQEILRQKLAGFDLQTETYATHAWLHLPEPWRGAAFARASRARGVGVLPADAFAVGREILAHAVRINVGAARSQSDFRRALDILVDLLNSGHLQVAGVV